MNEQNDYAKQMRDMAAQILTPSSKGKELFEYAADAIEERDRIRKQVEALSPKPSDPLHPELDCKLMKERVRVSDEGWNFHMKRVNALMEQVNQRDTAIKSAIAALGGDGNGPPSVQQALTELRACEVKL